MDSVLSNHAPRFLIGDSGTMSASPILMLFMLIIESCCLVSMTRNSVLASFRGSLSSAIHFFYVYYTSFHGDNSTRLPVLLLRTKRYIRLCIVGERMSPRQMFCDDVEQFAGVYSEQKWSQARALRHTTVKVVFVRLSRRLRHAVTVLINTNRTSRAQFQILRV